VVDKFQYVVSYNIYIYSPQERTKTKQIQLKKLPEDRRQIHNTYNT